MVEKNLPEFTNEEEETKFYSECSICENNQSNDALTECDSQISKYGLEIIVYDDGSSEYLFKVVQKNGLTVLGLSKAHVIALQQYLSLDMERIGITDDPPMYVLLNDLLTKLGGFCIGSQEKYNIKLNQCKGDVELNQKLKELEGNDEEE